MSEAELEELERKETEVWPLVASQQHQRKLMGLWLNGFELFFFLSAWRADEIQRQGC